MKFIGIDLHTNCFTACFLDEAGNKSIITYELNNEGIEKFFEKVTLESYVLVEATINSFCFVNMIKSNVGQVIVANTYELKTISFTNKKTDKVDAYKLARIMKSQIMSGEEQVRPVVVAPEKIQDLRALYSVRKSVLNFQINLLMDQLKLPDLHVSYLKALKTNLQV